MNLTFAVSMKNCGSCKLGTGGPRLRRSRSDRSHAPPQRLGGGEHYVTPARAVVRETGPSAKMGFRVGGNMARNFYKLLG